MKDIFCKGFDQDFVKQNLMGPNSLLIMSELAQLLDLRPGMKVLDLGCGKGLTSFLLAKEYGVTVFATDLWVSATENLERTNQLGLADKVFPVQAEAHALPFAHGFFDVAVSVDAYHYFGTDENYLYYYLAPLVKKGGQLGIAVPGLTREFENGVPEGLKPFWTPDMNSFHSETWWQDLWKRSGVLYDIKCRNFDCHDKAWEDWLNSGNPHAKDDANLLKNDESGYLATVSVVARRA